MSLYIILYTIRNWKWNKLQCTSLNTAKNEKWFTTPPIQSPRISALPLDHWPPRVEHAAWSNQHMQFQNVSLCGQPSSGLVTLCCNCLARLTNPHQSRAVQKPTSSCLYSVCWLLHWCFNRIVWHRFELIAPCCAVDLFGDLHLWSLQGHHTRTVRRQFVRQPESLQNLFIRHDSAPQCCWVVCNLSIISCYNMPSRVRLLQVDFKLAQPPGRTMHHDQSWHPRKSFTQMNSHKFCWQKCHHVSPMFSFWNTGYWAKHCFRLWICSTVASSTGKVRGVESSKYSQENEKRIACYNGFLGFLWSRKLIKQLQLNNVVAATNHSWKYKFE